MPFHCGLELIGNISTSENLIKEEVRVWWVGEVKANWRKEKWVSACFLWAGMHDCDCRWISDDVSRRGGCQVEPSPSGLTSSNVGGDVRGGQTQRRVGHVSTRVCLEEGKCHVVENFHDEQSELNDDGGLCNCWGQRWRPRERCPPIRWSALGLWALYVWITWILGSLTCFSCLLPGRYQTLICDTAEV